MSNWNIGEKIVENGYEWQVISVLETDDYVLYEFVRADNKASKVIKVLR